MIKPSYKILATVNRQTDKLIIHLVTTVHYNHIYRLLRARQRCNSAPINAYQKRRDVPIKRKLFRGNGKKTSEVSS